MFLFKSFFFFPVFVFIAVSLYNCYLDIRYRKVKNNLLLGGAAIGLAFSLISSCRLHGYYWLLISNLTLSIIIAAIFWYLNIWAAGDGKFLIFTAIFVVFLISSNFLNQAYPYFPVIFVILTNAFILAFTFLCLKAIGFFLSMLPGLFYQKKKFKKWLNKAKGKIKNTGFILLQLRVILFYLIVIISFSIISRLISSANLLFQQNYFIILYLGLILAYPFLQKALNKVKTFYLVVLAALLALYLKNDLSFLLKSAGKFFLVLGFIRLGINWFLKHSQSQTIDLKTLKPNMLLAPEEIEEIPIQQRPQQRFLSDGLLEGQVQQLKDYFNVHNKKTVKIYHTFPFVPFIFGAVIVTAALEGQLLNMLFFLF